MRSFNHPLRPDFRAQCGHSVGYPNVPLCPACLRTAECSVCGRAWLATSHMRCAKAQAVTP